MAERTPSTPSYAASDAFDIPVVIMLDTSWVYLENARTALHYLETRFPDSDAPSCRRAIVACVDCISGTGSGAGARATFVVAAMEAGYQFDVIDDPEIALERKTDFEAEIGLASILRVNG